MPEPYVPLLTAKHSMFSSGSIMQNHDSDDEWVENCGCSQCSPHSCLQLPPHLCSTQKTAFPILWQCRLASSWARLPNLAACTMHSNSSPPGNWCFGNFLTPMYRILNWTRCSASGAWLRIPTWRVHCASAWPRRAATTARMLWVTSLRRNQDQSTARLWELFPTLGIPLRTEG